MRRSQAIVSGAAVAYIAPTPLREASLGEFFDLSSLIDEFRDEARQQLDVLDAALLTLERHAALPTEQSLALLRALHTLKGNSGMLGYVVIRDFVHEVESVFRAPEQQWTQDLLDDLFTGAALLRRAVDLLGTEQEADALAGLTSLSPRADATAPPAPPAPPADPQPAPRAPPGPAPVPPADAPPAQPPPAEASASVGVSTEMLRIPFEKLDALASHVADLVGAHASLEAFLVENRVALDALELRRPLAARVEELDRVSDAIRAAVGDLRLVPIARVFSRFPSLVRNLAHAQGKRIQVVLEGDDTELDRSTIDALAEPLLHLVRNAVDHGVGRPERREQAGKPATGTITLRAAQRGDMVRVEVEDDGLGLDRARILERARASGLIEPDERPDDRSVIELIFRPGFSTRSEADTVSGRGIGMDVVASSVARLRGSIDVEDEPGAGTRFILELPLTLVVLPVLLFEADGETLALSAMDVEDTERVIATGRAAGAEVLRRGDELIPLARPARIFGWATEDGVESPPQYAVVVRRGTRAVAVAADRLLDQRDVVVKPLPPFLEGTPGVSGATIAPDGRVVLLLDAGDVINLNLELHRRVNRVIHPGQDRDRRR